MPSNTAETEAPAPSVPSMLDLVRLSTKRLFPPGGVELYRQIALLTEMSPSHEVLDVASGRGVPLEYFATEFGVVASGVDIDPAMVEEAEWSSRELQSGDRLQFQTGRSDGLPYRDEIFDIAIGEIGLANHCDPAEAVNELVRVTKPGGFVVLVQLVWKAPVDPERRAVLSDHLGARPLMVVEWRRLLKEAGVADIYVEDWADEETAFRPEAVKPFPDFAEMFTLGERLAILRRAWKRWGWRGVRAAVAREAEVHKLLTSERILGLDLIRGRKAGGEVAGRVEVATATTGTTATKADTESAESTEGGEDATGPKGGAAADLKSRADGVDGPSDIPETAGLPLFGGAAKPSEEDN